MNYTLRHCSVLDITTSASRDFAGVMVSSFPSDPITSTQTVRARADFQYVSHVFAIRSMPAKFEAGQTSSVISATTPRFPPQSRSK